MKVWNYATRPIGYVETTNFYNKTNFGYNIWLWVHYIKYYKHELLNVKQTHRCLGPKTQLYLLDS